MENVEQSIVWPHVNSIHGCAGPSVTHVPNRLLLPYMEAINCLGIIGTCQFEDRVHSQTMADVSSRQLAAAPGAFVWTALCQFYDKLMRILQHSQVLVSLFFESSCIDMIMPTRPAVHYSRPVCPIHINTSPTFKPVWSVPLLQKRRHFFGASWPLLQKVVAS